MAKQVKLKKPSSQQVGSDEPKTKNDPSLTPSQIKFSIEQGQILGQVYQLILSWRRERLASDTPTKTIPAEVEA